MFILKLLMPFQHFHRSQNLARACYLKHKFGLRLQCCQNKLSPGISKFFEKANDQPQSSTVNVFHFRAIHNNLLEFFRKARSLGFEKTVISNR